MGLDFYPEGPHFSYSGFSYFRNNIVLIVTKKWNGLEA